MEPIRVLEYTSGATRQVLPSRAIKASGACFVMTSRVTSDARTGSLVGRISDVCPITGPLRRQEIAAAKATRRNARGIIELLLHKTSSNHVQSTRTNLTVRCRLVFG